MALLVAAVPPPWLDDLDSRVQPAAAQNNAGKGDRKADRAGRGPVCPRRRAERSNRQRTTKGGRRSKSTGPGHRHCASAGQAQADFNADGFADLAVGVPLEDVDGVTDAGAVNVIYGSAAGLTATGNQLWHQNTPDVLDDAERFDNFGAALTAGDFDGDGYADLASGAPGEDVNDKPAAGAVNLLFGSAAGLTPAANQLWHQDVPEIEGESAPGDRFGSALASADFGFGAQADLAVGSPFEDFAGASEGGAVNVIYGSAVGLATTADQVWHQDIPGVPDEVERQDFFGRPLAAGDFDANGFVDLAVGIPQEAQLRNRRVGAVTAIYAGPSGLVAGATVVPASQHLVQTSTGVRRGTNAGEEFGAALASADFDGDRFADLAIGIPFQKLRRKRGRDLPDVGRVRVVAGGSSGLGRVMVELTQGGGRQGNEDHDHFGRALAAGDFDGDGGADLAVGVPFETLRGRPESGAVRVFHSPLAPGANQLWHQGRPAVPDRPDRSDLFGIALTAWDFGNGPQADLAIGASGEKVGGKAFAGSATVLYGSSPAGIGNGAAPQLWHQDSAGIADGAERGDAFGSTAY